MSKWMRLLPFMGWFCLAVLVGLVGGYSGHQNPIFCKAVASFCGLSPFGFYSISILMAVLLFGTIDLLKMGGLLLSKPMVPMQEQQLTWIIAQTGLSALGLLLLLTVGFMNAAS